jgi:hypothetical protein
MTRGAQLEAAVVFQASGDAAGITCADLSVVADIWPSQSTGAI